MILQDLPMLHRVPAGESDQVGQVVVWPPLKNALNFRDSENPQNVNMGSNALMKS